jgi:hypothetical protein
MDGPPQGAPADCFSSVESESGIDCNRAREGNSHHIRAMSWTTRQGTTMMKTSKKPRNCRGPLRHLFTGQVSCSGCPNPFISLSFVVLNTKTRCTVCTPRTRAVATFRCTPKPLRKSVADQLRGTLWPNATGRLGYVRQHRSALRVAKLQTYRRSHGQALSSRGRN